MALIHPEPRFSPSSFADMHSSSSIVEGRYPHVRAYLRSLGGGLDETDAIVNLLEEEQEEDLKRMLQNGYGIYDSEALEQTMLELMHKHRDDMAGIPFLHLTQTRRPISRPNSRPSSPSVRISGSTPPSSPRASIIFRRPHTPATSPLASALATSYMSAGVTLSPQSSPTLAYARVQYTASLPASPLSSPRLLNAKAHEFKPIQRPLSAASSHPIIMRTETPSPDMWAHSPLRTSSNLAIAAPLVAEHSHLRDSRGPGEFYDDDDDEITYDPFPSVPNKNDDHTYLGNMDYEPPWSLSNSSGSSNDDVYRPMYDSYPPQPYPNMTPAPGEEDEVMLTDGMTPFDVLSSVFGSTIAPSELEDGLAANGYEFEKAMAWLVDRALPPTQSTPATQQQVRAQNVGGRVTVVSRDAAIGSRGRGAVNGAGRGAGRGAPNNRVCRYFVAGECLRADCRFSHDLERALCRFWLRGTCAKNESCEFLHHLPKDVDVTALTSAMNRANIGYTPMANNRPSSPPPDEFPALGRGGLSSKQGGFTDMSRTRFATAVKKPSVPNDPARVQAMGRTDDLYHRSAIIAPRPSPRIALRSPVLLPTLPTGESINSLYLAYRSRALQLGAARNACLSRAADAWRRGDGAAAKRFSREGHELNSKMNKEMTEAASKLVRERVKIAVDAVKARDASWSDDPGDRSARGRLCGGGLGVCLGIASANVVASSAKDKRMTPEERTECMIDLHGLHANEATEVLEEFLMALEREHYYGLTYLIVGSEKHVGTQDPGRGASRARLAKGVKEWVHRWSYPWQERDGIICLDVQTHASS